MVPFSSAALGNFHSALDTVKRVLTLLDEPPPEGHSQWNGSLLAEALTADEAETAGRQILRENAVALYGL